MPLIRKVRPKSYVRRLSILGILYLLPALLFIILSMIVPVF